MCINTLKKMGVFPFPGAFHSQCMMRNGWLNGFRMGESGLVLLLYYLALIFFSVFSASAKAIELNFSTKIKPAPCTVTLTGGNAGDSNIDFGNVDSADIIRAGNKSPVKVFQLTLSDCGVDANTALLFTPTITVSGAAGTVSEQNDYVYRGPNSTSKGYGFFMNFNGTQVKWSGSGVPAGEVANVNTTNCNKITTSKNGSCAVLPTTWWRSPIDIAVAPTSAVREAGDTSLQAGSIIADITFTFDYP